MNPRTLLALLALSVVARAQNTGLVSISSVSSLSAYTGSTSIVTVGTLTTGTWNASVVAGQYGGTGVANTGKTITLGGNLATSGAFGLTFTLTAATGLTLPTTGTLSTLSGAESLTNKKLGSLTSNGVVTTSGGDGTLSVTGTTGTAGSSVLSIAPKFDTTIVVGSASTSPEARVHILSADTGGSSYQFLVRSSDNSKNILALSTVTGAGQFALYNAASSSQVVLNAVGQSSFADPTEATTGGGGALATSGGFFAAKKIIGGSDVEAVGNVVTDTAGKTLLVKSGANAAAGTVTLVAGTATITSTAIDANTVIIFSEKTAGGTPGLYQPLAAVTSGSATVSSAATDASTYNWVALKVN